MCLNFYGERPELQGIERKLCRHVLVSLFKLFLLILDSLRSLAELEPKIRGG